MSRVCSLCHFPLPREEPLQTPPSPVPDLLMTNSVPLPSQWPEVRHAITAAQTDISRLDEEIARVSRVLSELEAERQSLQKHADEHQALLTPARRLFPDILSEIFRRCSRGSVRKRLPEVLDSFNPKQGPLLLTQICRSWRSVAISTPDLWTLVRVVVRRPRESQLRLVESWLARSAALPLTVGIMEVKPQPPESHYPSYDWSGNAALTALALQSHRWQTAYFMLPPSKITWDSFAIVQKNLPLLRNLTVNVSRATFPQKEVVEIFRDAPRLTSLMLDYGTPISALRFPRLQITYLEIRMHRETPASTNSCLEALDELPNLEECLLHVGCSEPWTTIRTVNQKRLLSLTVIVEPLREDSLDRTVASLFTHLTLPSLKSLTVQSLNNDRPWDNHSFVNFISRSPHLEELTLHCTEAFRSPIIDILMETPDISWLSLTAESTDLPQIFTTLALTGPRLSGCALLPKLKNLEIVLIGNIKGLPLSFVDLVRSRTTGAERNKVCRLESVKLTYANGDPRNLSYNMTCVLHELGTLANIQIFHGTHPAFISEYRDDMSYDI